ncbi:MAG: translation initiation factor IF-2 subunit gamma [Candidatus Diapherotrites archaeon]|nr:translation initiation factor IF-2 subunit gamma [Candidatus Diapherotrites archaeon]
MSKQAEVNIGLIGHVDSGKTSLVKALTGKWTDTHSEELKRGITIRLGYADMEINQCEKCGVITKDKTCPKCGAKTKPKRAVALIDAPGHEALMTVVISSSAIMDGAILVIAANEPCPQPQTYEHFKVLEIMGIKKLVVAQNKIDLVTKEEALKNYKQIKEFLKGTFAENAPIIPVAAHHGVNIDKLCQAIEEHIPSPKRDSSKPPMMFVARSFDVNKPGTPIEKLAGGVLGGSLIQGEFKVGDSIELKPGIEKEGKWQQLETKIASLNTCGKEVKTAKPGGLIGVGTYLDPSLAKSDTLVGNICGKGGTLPEAKTELTIDAKLMERVIGMDKVTPFTKNETLVATVGTATAISTVAEVKPLKLLLKKPVCAEKGWIVALSRRVGNRWRLMGYGKII